MNAFNYASLAACLTAILFTQSPAALAAGTPEKQCPSGANPAFSDYAVPARTIAKRPKLKTNNEFSHMFVTRLSNGLEGNDIDFAGHYIVVTIGCGNGCLYGGYIDAESGQARELPFSVSPPGLYREEDPIEHRADSRLLIVSGNLNDADGPAMKYFFALKDNKLQPICYAPLNADAPHNGGE